MKKAKLILFAILALLYASASMASTASVLRPDSLVPTSVEKGKKGIVDNTRGYHPTSRPTSVPSSVSFKTSLKLKSFSGGVIFNETFEEAQGTSPFPLPDGWTRQTERDDDSFWYCSGMNYQDEPVAGHSGDMFAWMLNNTNGTAHNSWAFTRQLQLEAGVTYKLRFYVLLVGQGDVHQHVKMYLGTSPAIASMQQELADVQGEYQDWHEVTTVFTVNRSGSYYLGMQECTEANGQTSLVDDISIIEANAASLIDGNETLDFGEVYTQEQTATTQYRIMNLGSEPLTVSLQSASAELSFDHLPLTIEPDSWADIDVTLTIPAEGDYQGSFTLATNDAKADEVTIAVSAHVSTLRETGFWFEDFETPGLPGWELSYGSANVTVYGIEESRSYYGSTYTGNMYMMTHLIDMGDNPEISFSYRFDKDRFFEEDPIEPADMSHVRMTLLVSTDFGRSWDEVWQGGAGTDNVLEPTTDYAQFKLSLPQYAGQKAIFFLFFDRVGGNVMTDSFIINIDEMAFGTHPKHFIYLSDLRGETGYELNASATNTVKVRNLGTSRATGYTIELVDRQGNVLATADGPELEAGQQGLATLTWKATKPGAVIFHAHATAEGRSSDSPELPVLVVDPELQAVTVSVDGDLVGMSAPFCLNMQGVCQNIYYPQELGTNYAFIHSLTYAYISDAPFHTQPVHVWLGETDKADFADGKAATVDEWTEVFYGQLWFDKATKSINIPFTVPYEYHGRNLVVCIQYDNYDYIYGKYFMGNKTSEYRTLVFDHTYSIAEAETLTGVLSAAMPQTLFGMLMTGNGSINGSVTDTAGQPLAGATVSITGTSLTAVTDGDGHYAFPVVAVGNYKLTARLHRYYDAEPVETSVSEGQTATCNLQLAAIPVSDVAGSVTDAATGLPVKGATVALYGYDDVLAFTDDDGHFTVTDVCAGFNYDLTVTAPYFHNYVGTTFVESGMTPQVVSLREKTLAPYSLSASLNTDGSAQLNWQKPMPQFRLDEGTVVDNLGYTDLDPTYVMGNAWQHSALLHKISWYVCGTPNGVHDSIYVFVLDLNSDGTPSKNVLWSGCVPSTDDTWSSYELPEPVECPNGFYIGIGSPTFTGLAVSLPSDDYPFQSGQAFYSAGSFLYFDFKDMDQFAHAHFLVRAEGEDLGRLVGGECYGQTDSTQPSLAYSLYRFTPGDERSDWEMIADGEPVTTFVDDDFATMPKDFFSQWAVEAVYPDGAISNSVLSNELTATNLGIVHAENRKVEAENVFYNLSGQRVGQDYRHGIVINKRGKKMVR